ncbi:hypothetical protein RBSWK_01578 [Rhodopirellula baltica SWK14]|uniref:Uncharacterized protein n=1 Tax=Rhodopirellula baltica SWK14 TaxID=993516 RepID=L7CLM3_RHOBT|nr:hypothetical protein RBSWK_01578 [Rhodopirellula baltica SWK14]
MVCQSDNGRDNRVAAIDFPLSKTTTPRLRFIAWFAAIYLWSVQRDRLAIRNVAFLVKVYRNAMFTQPIIVAPADFKGEDVLVVAVQKECHREWKPKDLTQLRGRNLRRVLLATVQKSVQLFKQV